MSTNATENGIVKSEFLKKIGITHYGKVGREKFATDAKSKNELGGNTNVYWILHFSSICNWNRN